MMRFAAILAIVIGMSACAVIVEPAGSKGAHGHDVTLCHKGKKTMTLPAEAAEAHFGHGDTRGPC